MSSVRKDILVRSGCVYIAMIVLFVAVLVRIVMIQFVEGETWRAMGRTGVLRVDSIEAARGNIYDTNGNLLASSVPEYRVRFDIGTEYLRNKRNRSDVDARFFHHVDTMANVFAKVISKKSAREYNDLLRKEWQKKEQQINKGEKRIGSPHYVFGNTRHIVSYLQLEDEIKKAAIFRQKQYESGLVTELRYKRRKPYEHLATSLIGDIFTSYESGGRGHSGIEQRYESELRGTKGFSVNAGGLIKTTEPTPGSDITLTLDVDLQYFAERALLKQLQTIDADEGCAVLMDVKTGKIRAIANLKKRKNGTYTDSINIAMTSMQEPGSVFKVMSMMIALEDGVVQSDDKFDTGEGYRMYHYAGGKPRKMEDTSRHGIITASEIIQMSSNVGVSDIITRHYRKNPEDFINKIRATGFTQKLDFGISFDSVTYVPRINNPSQKHWNPTSLPWLSIGYESQIPPIYTLMFYNAIANGGVMVKPYFVEKISKNNADAKVIEPKIVNPAICSPATLQKLVPMMEMVVEKQGGTAFRTAKSPLFLTAGKTGTSVIRGIYQATFCGFFPADSPQYSAIVVVRKRGKVYGGGGGGPVFREIAEKAFLLNERRNPTLLADAQMQHEPIMKNDKFEKLADVVGMGLSNAVYFLEKSGYTVQLNSNNNVGTVREIKQNGKSVELVLN